MQVNVLKKKLHNLFLLCVIANYAKGVKISNSVFRIHEMLAIKSINLILYLGYITCKLHIYKKN